MMIRTNPKGKSEERFYDAIVLLALLIVGFNMVGIQREPII
jgi:hypothetical protein